MRKRISAGWAIACVGMFAAISLGVFFGVQFFTKTGIFRIPGVVYYDESLTAAEVAKLQEIFATADLDKDVTISGNYNLEYTNHNDTTILYDILVPVTDFYSTETNVTAADATELLNNSLDYKLISIDNLNFQKKLLAINDNYYLDNFTTGGVYRTLSFATEKPSEIKELVAGLNREFPNKDTVLTFAQTGVTALSRGMNAKLYKVGNAEYFAAEIGDYLSGFDITHTSNESSFTDYASASNICSDKRFINTLLAIGLDVVELTGNHNQDCGDTAALETIDTYVENGIKMVGGGKTAAEAAEPLELEEKSTKITMLAFNQSTGGATYDNTPGANQYYEDMAAAQIKAAKAAGDFVIVDIQYYECNAYASTYEDPICDYADSAAGDQIGFFRHLIDLGADVVVGTSAHQPQTFELYGDGVIYYGLGNLFFDQSWWPGTTRSLILAHYFYNGELLQTKLVPTVYDSNLQTRLLDAATSEWFIQRLINARPAPAANSAETEIQAVVDKWATNLKGNKSVLVYDIDDSEILASYNPSEGYNTASLYKLFVVYEGYKRVENGTWDGAQKIVDNHTILDCLDLAVRESYSPCAERLWAMIGADNLDTIIENEWGIKKSDISKLYSNPNDIMKIMLRFYQHPDFKNSELLARMWDSFLNQPTTTYNWRQGLPSGFSSNAKVYNKVGWDYDADKKRWNIYHDAAIVEINNKHYIIVVMTNYIDFSNIKNLANQLEPLL